MSRYRWRVESGEAEVVVILGLSPQLAGKNQSLVVSVSVLSVVACAVQFFCQQEADFLLNPGVGRKN